MNVKIISVLLFYFINAVSQVNTEKYRTPDDLRGWAGFIEISGTIQSGNAEKKQGALDGRLDWKTEKTTTFFVSKSQHEWIKGNRLSNEGLLHIRNVFLFKYNLSSEIFGQINYDKKILVDDRELLGAGLRLRVLQLNESEASVGSAYMFEREKYNLPENAVHPQEVNVSRWSTYVSLFSQMTPFAQLSGVLYYQPVFNRFSDFRVLSESNLTISFSHLLSFSLNFRIRHDSDPPDNIKKTDMHTNFGISLKF